jgi:response regulator RpfG family c-di-GMP phosphodiesterase
VRFVDDDDLYFAEEEAVTAGPAHEPWKLLIVDDEQDVHDTTRLALSNFRFNGREIRFLHAYSAGQAQQMLQREADVAVALVDVVMEHEHAGLDLIRFIREGLKNRLVRLILRTGQPGQAPERKVIQDYDINDYKEKSELSSQKLFSTIYAALRSYQDLQALDSNRQGLTRIIRASKVLFKPQHIPEFIQGVLEQLVAVLHLDRDSMYIQSGCFAVEHDTTESRIVAATGHYSGYLKQDPFRVLPERARAQVETALRERRDVFGAGSYTAYFSTSKCRSGLLYFSTPNHLSEGDYELVNLFCQNVGLAYQNVLLREEIESSQREIVYLLGESIERRSRETGNHVHRVAAYSHLLGKLYGLDERDNEMLLFAAPLHDFGKVGVPDAILHKPGKLDAEEWEVMKRHAMDGYEIMVRSKREVLQMGAVIAKEHHERWDGNGYPSQLRGEEIALVARIVALADVFDALQSRRCYKPAWTEQQVLDYLREQSGSQFDPELVRLLLEHVEQFREVTRLYPDPQE